MNKPISCLSESDLEYRMTKKGLTQLEVTTYTNKVHILFSLLDYRNTKINRVLLELILCWVTSKDFNKKHMSKDKTS